LNKVNHTLHFIADDMGTYLYTVTARGLARWPWSRSQGDWPPYTCLPVLKRVAAMPTLDQTIIIVCTMVPRPDGKPDIGI
jgi:hypothetical protein